MYVGLEVSARAATARRVAFHCARCGCRAHVVAEASASGSGHAPFFLGQKSAERAAIAAAEASAGSEALRLARLARCPSCRKRRTSAVVITVLRQSAHILWLVPVLCCLSVMALMFFLLATGLRITANGGAEIEVAVCVGLVASLASVVLLVRRKLSRADAQVTFDDVRQ